MIRASIASLVAGVIIAITGSMANAACLDGHVSPADFRATETGMTRWNVNRHVYHTLGHVHKRWTGDDGYQYQERRYLSTWQPGTQVRATFVRLTDDSHWLLLGQLWCNQNDYGFTVPDNPTQYTCKPRVWS